MLLKELFPQHYQSDSIISSIETDSRLVKSGSIFFALKGFVTNGEKFIDSAFQKGAIAVFCGNDCLNPDPRIIKIKNIHDDLANALQKFYVNLPTNIFAVTGTNGKTSIVHFIGQIQEILGKKSASIGTLGVKVNDSEIQKKLTSFELTTPDIVSLYKNLAILKQNEVDDVAIEVSSIGLDQKRMQGVRIKLGAFSNFTQDHLDYHGSMEKYFDCKMVLFTEILQANDFAILNADIAKFGEMKKIATKRNLRIVSYSAKESATSSASITENEIRIFDKKYPFKISMSGDFQKTNLICALLSVVCYYDLDEKKIACLIQNLHKVKPAEGRMQKVAELKNGAQIFIDYAHTPDALKNVLETAKHIPHNKIHVLFGCGGDRDKLKRPQMGEIASDLADFVIVSDDNARNEDGQDIRNEILSACDLAKTIQIGDRRKAIIHAISELKENDILILAGKGHEKYQVIGIKKFEFDEEEIVKEAVIGLK
ncbi:MAG: UDP-N-acetylmuramoyl-L-alanyl-D-glutamate--2,6-diaminopimelate ligase [Myxococcota bacterium]|jgi:UDP-N-acetylmuramoyl-L-alanyl-D-glutamate--2,6-diaminopimelate ligase